MSTNMIETITNWNNTLRATYGSDFIKICSLASKHKDSGHSRDTSLELLMSRGISEHSAEEALNEVYGSKATKGSKTSSSINVFLVPTKYSDVSRLVEAQLLNLGAEQFVSKLTDSEMPIIEASKKHKESLLRLASKATESQVHMDQLHNEIAPYIEEAMLNSVLIAEREAGNISRVSESQYNVEFTGRKTASVNLETGRSTGARYTKGNFEDFGIADEFLIKVHDTVSPYTRLKKII